MRLTVIGCGHLGAVHAACMAEIGHEVLGVDIDEGKVALLNSGKAWFYEPGLDEMLARNIASGRLRFSMNLSDAAQFGSVHFLGVATPGLPDGSYDLSQVEAAMASVARYVKGSCLFVGKSTVPPGTAKRLYAVATSISPAESIEMAWNPEFLREGSAVRDTLIPDRIVVGAVTEFAETTLRKIYQPLTDAGIPLVVMDYATAELVKGAANAFLATKISFINAMAEICSTVNGDIHALAGALGLDHRIGHSFLKAGIGYGGACLPKDVRGLASFAQGAGAHGASELLMLVDTINATRRDLVVRLVVQALSAVSAGDYASAESLLSGKRIACLGAAFKSGTDDVRDSPALEVANRLHLLGASLTVYDPMAAGNALTASPELAYVDSALAAIDQADLVVVATAWPEFAELNPAAAGAAATSMIVVDACQGIDIDAWQSAGWRVLSLAGGQARPRSAAGPTAGRSAMTHLQGNRRLSIARPAANLL